METPTQPSLSTFYFGPQAKALYGACHLPPPDQAREVGVVLCNPWQQEFIRGHRTLSQLSQRLARQGLAVLRFDYYGTGDSAGADADGTLEQWQNDLRQAIQELKRRARLETVYLVGLRLGAALAALVASGRADVEGLVLWEPAVRGADYLHELRAWNEEKQLSFLNQAQMGQTHVELLGFGLHPGFVGELEKLDLLALKRSPARHICLIEGAAAPAVAQLQRQLEQLGAQVEYHLIPSFKLWAEDPDKGLVPQPIVEAIVTWLNMERA